MKIGTITTPNQKGQIVIPHDMRKALGISPDTPLHITLQQNSVLIQPIKQVVHQSDHETAYLEALKKTQGSWAKNKRSSKIQQTKKELELTASKDRKKHQKSGQRKRSAHHPFSSYHSAIYL